VDAMEAQNNDDDDDDEVARANGTEAGCRDEPHNNLPASVYPRPITTATDAAVQDADIAGRDETPAVQFGTRKRSVGAICCFVSAKFVFTASGDSNPEALFPNPGFGAGRF